MPRVHLFGKEDCAIIVDTLDKTDLSHLKRFSLSAIKTQIDDEGFIEIINRISKIKSLEDVHICAAQTGLTSAIIDPLHSFIIDTKSHLKKFDVSLMWCMKIDEAKKKGFKSLLYDESSHLEEIGFDMVRTKRPPQEPTKEDIAEAKARVEKIAHH